MSYSIKHLLMTIPFASVAAAGACSSDKSGEPPSGGGPDAGAQEAGGGGSGGTGAAGTAAGGKGAAGASSGGNGGAAGGTPTDAATSDGGECASGCTCSREETCDYSCSANCSVECLGGTCTAGCMEGGCTLDADFGAHAQYACLGGGCHTDCDNGSTCEVDCSGGGCDVVCDGGSTCTVTCKPTGSPCSVTCEGGGAATCVSGNCNVVGCGDASACDKTPDPSYHPVIKPADFTSTIDNPLSPWPPGATWAMKSSTEDITITVLSTKKTILGVECVVVQDTVKDPTTGDLVEDTFDWFAQDKDGNVWYFGEDTKSFVNGAVVSTHGSWEAGVDGALPGIVMPASPTVTKPPTPYRQEYLPCEAEDEAEVIETGVSIKVTSGSYKDCIRTREFTRLEPTGAEFKTYCPGVGNVLVEDAVTNERLEQLTTVTIP